MPVQNNAITAFWARFQECAKELAASKSADCAACDDLLAQLQMVAPGLYIEFCACPQSCELIVTAEGDRELFSTAHAIVAAAPIIDGWAIRALKPKLGFPESTTWEGFKLPIAGVVFEPFETQQSGLGLRLLVPGLHEKDVPAAHNALLRALDHGLGEERFAEAVQGTQVVPLVPGTRTSDYIPITDLEKFIKWRERHRAKGG